MKKRITTNRGYVGKRDHEGKFINQPRMEVADERFRRGINKQPFDAYWWERELMNNRRLEDEYIEVFRTVQSNKRRAIEDIENRINEFYIKYAEKERLHPSRARAYLDNFETDKFHSYMETIMKQVKENGVAGTRSDSFKIINKYTAKQNIQRLEWLKGQVLGSLSGRTIEEEKLFRAYLKNVSKEEFERQAGIYKMSMNFDEGLFYRIVDASFHGAKFSDRIWKNQDNLYLELEKILTSGMLMGTGPIAMAREMRKAINSSIYNSERLLRTESARIQADTFEASMENFDYEKYIFIAQEGTPTSPVCPICQDLDGKVFKVKDMEIGVNMYPMHPNCRCATSAFIDREEWEKNMREQGFLSDAEKIAMAGEEIPDEYVDATTMFEAEQKAQAMLGRMTNIDYSLTELDFANETNKGIQKFMQRFPQLQNHLQEFSFVDSKNDYFGVLRKRGVRVGHKISLDSKINIANMGKVDGSYLEALRLYKREQEYNFQLPNGSPVTTAVHELSHALEDYVMIQEQFGGKTNFNTLEWIDFVEAGDKRKFATEITDKALENMGLKISKDASPSEVEAIKEAIKQETTKKLGNYTKKNKSELFVQAMADAIALDSDNRFSQEVYKETVKRMKKVDELIARREKKRNRPKHKKRP